MADALWCEMAVLEIEPETSDLKVSQPLSTSQRPDAQSSTACIDKLLELYLLQLNEQAPLFTNFCY